MVAPPPTKTVVIDAKRMCEDGGACVLRPYLVVECFFKSMLFCLRGLLQIGWHMVGFGL